MENASKALIMAASVLIALMIIGALILMFNGLSSYQEVGQQNTREDQVIAFNSQFETYNRKNVRGSDLYSLINRVVDYNRRKSTEGKGTNDEGQYLAYEPMTIKFTISSLEGLTADNKTNQLITQKSYTISSTTNDFKKVYNSIEKLEKDYGGKQTMQNLCTAINKIFITSTDTKDRVQAIINFNSAYGSIEYSIDSLENNYIKDQYQKMEAKYKGPVYQYYEYVQFKRARFDCKNTDYNDKTGRIKLMEFEFTGKFE